jgi:predicted metal-dependent hydrolase
MPYHDTKLINRQPHFDFSQEKPFDATSDTRQTAYTLFSHALSLIIPSYEKLFINTVRSIYDEISNEELKKDAQLFMAQEKTHQIWHDKYNDWLAQSFPSVPKMTKFWEKYIGFIMKHTSTEFKLMMTAQGEIYTAQVSKQVLGSLHLKSKFNKKNRESNIGAKLWGWHAAEECEHRAVSHGVYKEFRPSKLSHLKYISIIPFTAVSLFFGIVISAIFLAFDAKKHMSWRVALDFLFIQFDFKRGITVLFFKELLRSCRFNYNPLDDREDVSALLDIWYEHYESNLT